MEAIILAGGLGKRLRSTVPDLPKPMAPVRERPFLAWLMDYWADQGVTDFVRSVGYKWDGIRQYFGDSHRGRPIGYAREETPLGTGGGLLLAMRTLKDPGPFLLLNGDTFAQADLGELLNSHRAAKASLTMALSRVDDCSRYGSVQLSPDGLITGFKEKRAGSGSGLINAGVYLIEPAALQEFSTGRPLSLETDILPDLLQKRLAMAGCEIAGSFIDIGLPEDYERAASIVTGEH